MDVAYVSNVVYPFVTGGAEKRINELGTRLAARGHDVTVYGRHFWDGPPETTHEGMRLRAVAGERSIHAGDRRSIREAAGFAVSLWRPLRRHLDTHDVVVASVFPYFPVIPAATSCRTAGVPLVTTWHECWRGYWREYLGLAGVGGMAVERLVARLPQHPTAVSAVTADRLAGIGPDRDRIHVLPNGVDVARIRETAPAPEGFDVLFAGRLIEAKTVDVLLRAVADSDASASVGIVGDGPERDALEATARRLGVDDVTFLGFLDDHDDVLAHLRAAAVYVSPSTREGFGMTILEAMAAGCTVVAADHPLSAAAEILGDAGFLVEPDAASLRAGIERALAGDRPAADPDRHVEHYDWDGVAERAASLYERAIEGEW
jgi:glycosyltransferase involved in cell wall biosynthesis